MKTKTLAKKGFTLEVVSWENDADNYQTHTETYETKAEAVAMGNMCKELFSLFSSNNRNLNGIGNYCEGEETRVKDKILDYLDENELFEGQSNEDEDSLRDWVMEINHRLMGYSDFYISRVCESVNIYHSSEDVVINLIDMDAIDDPLEEITINTIEDIVNVVDDENIERFMTDLYVFVAQNAEVKRKVPDIKIVSMLWTDDGNHEITGVALNGDRIKFEKK